MMFNIKSVFFFGLVAVSTATPSSVLLPRAKIPEVLKCDGKEWTKAQILASKEKARELANSNYAYPDLFGNKDGHGQPIFGAQGQLWEFPLLDPPWTSKYCISLSFSYQIISSSLSPLFCLHIHLN